MEDLKRFDFYVDHLHWVSSPTQDGLSVKIRHGAQTYDCSLKGEGPYQVVLAEGDKGVAPGQYAVLYQNDQCLGGGVISR